MHVNGYYIHVEVFRPPRGFPGDPLTSSSEPPRRPQHQPNLAREPRTYLSVCVLRYPARGGFIPDMDTSVALRQTSSSHGSTLTWWVGCGVSSVCAVAWLLGLFLPFALFEGTYGTCVHLPCRGHQTGDWWGFFASDDMVGAVPFLTSAGIYVVVFCIFFWPALVLLSLLLPARLAVGGSLNRPFEKWKVALASLTLLLVSVAVLTALSQTGRDLIQVVMD